MSAVQLINFKTSATTSSAQRQKYHYQLQEEEPSCIVTSTSYKLANLQSALLSRSNRRHYTCNKTTTKNHRQHRQSTHTNPTTSDDYSNMVSVAYHQMQAVNRAKTIMKMKAKRRIRKKSNFKKKMRRLSKNRLTLRQVFLRYADTSTLHGFRFCCTNTYTARRVFWAALMIIGSVYFIIKLRDGLYRYYDYPFSTKTTTQYADNLTFPAISFCPINPFNRSKIQTSSVLERLFTENRFPIHNNWSRPDYDVPGSDLVESVWNTSFLIEDLFKDCDYIQKDTDNPNVRPRPCSHRNFTTYISKKGQLCFTLNSHQAGHEVLQVTDAGLKNGYEVMFDMHNSDAVRLLPYTGMDVVLHHPSEPPSVSGTGFVVTTGVQTFVQIGKTSTVNLPSPYVTECASLPLKHHVTYNHNACALELLTEYIVKRCGCRNMHMPDDGSPVCTLKEMTGCVLPATEAFTAEEHESKCPRDCVEISYQSKRTEAALLRSPPTGADVQLMKLNELKKGRNSSHLLRLRRKMSADEFGRYTRENIIVIIFYYHELSELINTHSPTFTFYNFLGDTGGAFSFVLGASLLTFFEFIDLFVMLFYNQLLRLYKTKSTDKFSHPKSWV